MANAIADSDYQEYPKIQNEMVAASKDLESAIEILTKTLQQRQDSALAQRWQYLLDACKVIAEKTTLLLQIVYGAEVKRFFECSEKAVESLTNSRVKLGHLAENPQQFVDSASEAATLTGTLINLSTIYL